MTTIMFWTLLVWGIAVAHVTAFVPSQATPFRSSSTTSKSQLWASKKKPSSRDDGSFDMDELRQRLAAETNPYAHLIPPRAADVDSFSAPLHDEENDSETYKYVPPETVHCIFFQPGTAEQGMHTVEHPAGSGSNVVLAFESKEACDKFANRLRDLQFFDPTPQQVGLSSLESFCETLGVFVQVVPAGVDLIPPSRRVETLGHKNPAIRREQSELDYIFAMLSTDEEIEEEGVLVTEYGSSWE